MNSICMQDVSLGEQEKRKAMKKVDYLKAGFVLLMAICDIICARYVTNREIVFDNKVENEQDKDIGYRFVLPDLPTTDGTTPTTASPV